MSGNSPMPEWERSIDHSTFAEHHDFRTDALASDLPQMVPRLTGCGQNRRDAH
ncbi:MAG: hypothetical protein L0H41_07700 [Microlunatus sp.]|nr:hypothetical protein [Microlunatus sp.]